jgi:hypothetical protein
MTPGQLIDLLEKAGMLKEESPGVLGWHPTMGKAERFAALVRADEREACAKVCEDVERQATRQPPMVGQGCQACAAAIRARGQQ